MSSERRLRHLHRQHLSQSVQNTHSTSQLAILCTDKIECLGSRTCSLQWGQFFWLVLQDASCRPRSRAMITMLQCWQRFGFQSHLKPHNREESETDKWKSHSHDRSPLERETDRQDLLVFVVIDFTAREFLIAEFTFRFHSVCWCVLGSRYCCCGYWRRSWNHCRCTR